MYKKIKLKAITVQMFLKTYYEIFDFSSDKTSSDRAVLIVPVLQTFKTSTESVLVFDTKVNESMFCDSEKPVRISSCCAF